MKSDDRTKKSQDDRQKLLEEIRRRAEEAELKRIEEEEQDRKISSSQRGPSPAAKEPPPPPSQKSVKDTSGRSAPAPVPPSSKTPAAQPPAASQVNTEPPSQIKKPAAKPAETKPPAPVPPSSQRVPTRVRSGFGTGVPPPPAEPPASVPFPAPFPIPSGETPAASAKLARDQRITVLRERLDIALDRGKIPKASDLLAELTSLIDDQTELEGYRSRLKEVQTRKESGKSKKSSQLAPPPPESKPTAPLPENHEQREARKKRVAELLESADSLYQGEKYEKGLQTINELLELDPANEEAPRLRAAIEKAQELALRIQAEETRRKAEEAADFKPAPVEAPKPVKSDKDVWGTSTIPTIDAEINRRAQNEDVALHNLFKYWSQAVFDSATAVACTSNGLACEAAYAAFEGQFIKMNQLCRGTLGSGAFRGFLKERGCIPRLPRTAIYRQYVQGILLYLFAGSFLYTQRQILPSAFSTLSGVVG